jgi:glycosyltransferase involved in cell wall biosynthesis
MLVEDGDGDALGEAAAAMVDQRDRWSRLGLERARTFSWDKAARETINAYESLSSRLG